MSPEDAYALLNRIEALRRLGDEILKQVPPEGPAAEPMNYKAEGWLSAVVDLVAKNFDGNSAFVARANALGLFAQNGSVTIQKALHLLDTVKGFVFIDPQSAASEPLRNLIEQTLKERYFKSWEVKLLVAAFGLVLTFFLGGTVYLGWQTMGVTETANAARHSIESERDTVVKLGNDVVHRIEADAAEQAREQIARLNDALRASTSSITKLNEQLIANQASLDQAFKAGQAAIDDTVKQAPANANAYLTSKQPIIDAATARLDTSIKASEQTISQLNAQLAVNNSKLIQAFMDAQVAIGKAADVKQLNKAVEDGQGDIKRATNDAVGQVPFNVTAYLATQRPVMDAVINKGVSEKIRDANADIESRRVTGIKQIQDKIDLVNIRTQNFEDELPAITKYLDNRIKEFNDVVHRYSGPIDAIVSRFSGSQQLSAIEAVSLVLGSAVWLTVTATGLAALAFVVAIWTLFRGRSPRVVQAAQPGG